MGFSFTYSLEGAGWATGQVQDGTDSFNFSVSYLHDSLRDLAEAARAFMNGAKEARIVFMDEPGETHLILQRTGIGLEYELRWFDDWNSWNMYPDDKFEVVHSGQTSVRRFVGEVRKELEALLKENGEVGYLEKWIEADFPTALLREIQQKSPF